MPADEPNLEGPEQNDTLLWEMFDFGQDDGNLAAGTGDLLATPVVSESGLLSKATASEGSEADSKHRERDAYHCDLNLPENTRSRSNERKRAPHLPRFLRRQRSKSTDRGVSQKTSTASAIEAISGIICWVTKSI